MLPRGQKALIRALGVAMTNPRFDYMNNRWADGDGDKDKTRRWYEELERTGPENVRARLAQTDAGSRGAFSIGAEMSMTIGFAQEWLAWHDRQRTEQETSFRRWQLFWSRWTALAASATALVAASAGH
jgi:hypothetical protein